MVKALHPTLLAVFAYHIGNKASRNLKLFPDTKQNHSVRSNQEDGKLSNDRTESMLYQAITTTNLVIFVFDLLLNLRNLKILNSDNRIPQQASFIAIPILAGDKEAKYSTS